MTKQSKVYSAWFFQAEDLSGTNEEILNRESTKLLHVISGNFKGKSQARELLVKVKKNFTPNIIMFGRGSKMEVYKVEELI